MTFSVLVPINEYKEGKKMTSVIIVEGCKSMKVNVYRVTDLNRFLTTDERETQRKGKSTEANNTMQTFFYGLSPNTPAYFKRYERLRFRNEIE